MKQLFAIFCALFLMPMVSAQAWIGGPFSNNTFFGEQGDDGVYEAVATGPNALGIYRIVVGNNFEGANPQGVQASAANVNANFSIEFGVSTEETIVIRNPLINSGNTVIGALGRPFNHIWFFEGVSYAGVSLGTASSILGQVHAVANAQRSNDLISRISSVPIEFRSTSSISSTFSASMERRGPRLPASAFSGTGTGRLSGDGIDPAENPPFNFFVIGSKVSSRILFGL
jgi:hypothetical protein